MARRILTCGCIVVLLLIVLGGIFLAGFVSKRGSLPEVNLNIASNTTPTVADVNAQSVQSTDFVDCTATVPTRLHPGMNATVAHVDGTQTRVRKSPEKTKSNWLFSVDEGKPVTIENENPQCDSAGRRWWKVSTFQGSGFMAENDGSTYLIDPGQ